MICSRQECICDPDDPCTCDAPFVPKKLWKVRESVRFTAQVAGLKGERHLRVVRPTEQPPDTHDTQEDR